jgi:hypothetical protein
MRSIETTEAEKQPAIRNWNQALPIQGSQTVRMQTKLSVGPLLALVMVCALALGACGGGGSTTVKSIAITPTAISVPINTESDFTATVTLTDSSTSTTTTVTWEVNGITGGDLNTVGSIVGSSTSALVGVYTAPPQVPTTSSGTAEQVGQLNITAVAQQSTSSTTTGTTGTVTSNTAIVTISVGLGLAVTPSAVTVPAGGTSQFTATFNSVLDTTATWTATSADGGTIGTIDSTGLFTAPTFPPPGGEVTITATHTSSGVTTTVTAIATIVYSDRSLSGPYAFSYTGNDQSGFLAVAGSFVSDGGGHIISGVEDFDSLLTGVSTQVPISGTYQVGTDGRGTATLNTERGTNTLRFVLTTNQHAQLVRFDSNADGGGTIDQQSLDALTGLPSVVSGSYVFAVLGADASFQPLGMAGAFTSNGLGGIPSTDAILDVNDNGISGSGVTVSDTTLNGSYGFDATFPGTGRGTLLLTSATTGSAAREYAFYAVGTALNSSGASFVTQLRLVEIDGTASVAGNVFSASTSAAGLASGNYVFASGGNSSAGAYASGGVFVSNGTGTITSGIFDSNRAGTYNNGPAIISCGYAVDATTGRIDLRLFTGSGTCPTGPSSSVSEFAVYPTSQGSDLMLELDSAAVSAGVAHEQCSAESAGCASTTPSLVAGSFALGLTGQGIFHNSTGSYQPDLSGQVTLSGTSVSSGNLDINNFSAVFTADPIASTGSSVTAPASTGRGTAVLALSNPTATYNLIYYLIDDDTALLFGQSGSPVAIGNLARQF